MNPFEPSSRPRASAAILLATLSPALLALSGCSSTPTRTTTSNGECDSTQLTPQTEDDCNRRSGTGAVGGVVGGVLAGQALRNAQRNAAIRRARQQAAQRQVQPSTPRGGFGGSGRFYGGSSS